ncbi:hypothetical protein [Streptomyces sp. NPDC048720]|uniref:hypothetical protein n=1 Tax=Streptomyces sp. NPDC048720 TaxID=3365588 RepID=UPI003711DA28
MTNEMVVDKNKKRIVFLEHDTIVDLVHLAKMHLNEDGSPKVLQQVPLSEEYAASLRKAVDSMEKVLKTIWEEEDDSHGK